MYIHWFRRDLRLHDNPALAQALRYSGGATLPVFVLDDAILQATRTAAVRVHFLLESLHALDAALHRHGARLLVLRGDPLPLLRDLIAHTGAVGVSWNEDYTPFARRRDHAVREMLAVRGVAALTMQDAVICGPDALRTGAGKPYTVYTPYRRAWRAKLDQERSDRQSFELPRFAPLPVALDYPAIPTSAVAPEQAQFLPPGGEAAGLERLHTFVQQGVIGGYAAGRDRMAAAATSRLSAYLRLGCVAPLACLRAAWQFAEQADDAVVQNGAETWISELIWRDFYYQILYHFPHVLRRSFRPQYDAVAWENRNDWFDAWCAGQTGYPVVDAAMRQLQREGWMHNRARMIVASFLTKDLLIDWRRGERYFMQMLVDGDHASNNGGWQWAAGTGTDAQPYFRIFNPVNQGRTFDPDGEYVRRYVPELSGVGNRFIHAPWTMPPDEQRRCGVQIGRDYPMPIVDHAQQRTKALAIYRAVTIGKESPA